MPNHIKNKLELLGSLEDIDSMIKQFGTEIKSSITKTHEGELVICKSKKESYGYCWLDLRTGYVHNRENLGQIGMPDEYEIEINEGFLCFPDFEKIIPPPRHDPAYNDLPTQEIAKHSSNWWRNWNIENWGTKWSGYSYERPAINIFTFETAWSGVPKLIEKMSVEHPNVTIKYTWADEDTGSNCGKITYHNGILLVSQPKSGSKEAYDIAFELRPDYAQGYELVNGNYKYVGED